MSRDKGAAQTYRDGVRDEPTVDMDAWSELLGELLTSARVSQAWLADEVQVDEKTVGRWRRKEFPPKPEMVRDVARALNYPALDALVRVGFLTPAEGGLDGAPAKAMPTIEPTLLEIQRLLDDEKIPKNVREHLRRGVRAARDLWFDMFRFRAPKEPGAPRADRTERNAH